MDYSRALAVDDKKMTKLLVERSVELENPTVAIHAAQFIIFFILFYDAIMTYQEICESVDDVKIFQIFGSLKK